MHQNAWNYISWYSTKWLFQRKNHWNFTKKWSKTLCRVGFLNAKTDQNNKAQDINPFPRTGSSVAEADQYEGYPQSNCFHCQNYSLSWSSFCRKRTKRVVFWFMFYKPSWEGLVIPYLSEHSEGLGCLAKFFTKFQENSGWRVVNCLAIQGAKVYTMSVLFVLLEIEATWF